MKRLSTKGSTTKHWAAAVVLAICAADGVGIYVAQNRLQGAPVLSAPETAYAAATETKDNWRINAPSPERRAFASSTAAASTAAPAAPVRLAAAAPAVAPQRVAIAAPRIAANSLKTDPFLAPPRLDDVAPAAPVELASEVHAARHQAALRRAAQRQAQRDVAPPTSQSFAAAFGGGATGALALPEPTFTKAADAEATPSPVATDTTRASAPTSVEIPRIDIGESATIGKTAQPVAETPDAELPATAAPAPQPAS